MRKSKLKRNKVNVDVTFNLDLEVDCIDAKQLEEKMIEILKSKIKTSDYGNGLSVGDSLNEYFDREEDYMKPVKDTYDKIKTVKVNTIQELVTDTN